MTTTDITTHTARAEVMRDLVAQTQINPQMTFEALRKRLELMHNNAMQKNQAKRAQAINEVWGHIAELSFTHDVTVTLATAAREMAQEMTKQRDAVARELKEIEEALEHQDVNHKKVGKLIWAIQDNVTDDLINDGYWITLDPADEIVRATGVAYDDASLFFNAITGAVQDFVDVPESLAEELKQLITGYARKFREETQYE